MLLLGICAALSSLNYIRYRSVQFRPSGKDLCCFIWYRIRATIHVPSVHLAKTDAGAEIATVNRLRRGAGLATSGEFHLLMAAFGRLHGCIYPRPGVPNRGVGIYGCGVLARG